MHVLPNFTPFFQNWTLVPKKADSEREPGWRVGVGMLGRERKQVCPEGFEGTSSKSAGAPERDFPAGIMQYSYSTPFHTTAAHPLQGVASFC